MYSSEDEIPSFRSQERRYLSREAPNPARRLLSRKEEADHELIKRQRMVGLMNLKEHDKPKKITGGYLQALLPIATTLLGAIAPPLIEKATSHLFGKGMTAYGPDGHELTIPQKRELVLTYLMANPHHHRHLFGP